MTLVRATKRMATHGALLAGCVIFAFPFVWLLSTSMKRNEELAVFPPRWIPRVPWYAERSPFVDGGAFDEMPAPAQLSRSAWQHLMPVVGEALWHEVQARPDFLARAVPPGTDGQERFRTQMVRGLWRRLVELVPDKTWKAVESVRGQVGPSDPLFAILRQSITEDLLTKVRDDVLRMLAVADVRVVHVNNDVVQPGSSSGWQTRGPASLTPTETGGEKALLVSYDLRKADSLSLVQTLRLPVTIDKIQVISVPIHCDASWHRAVMTIETGGKVYRGERPLWLDITTWQDAEFAFREPPYRGSRAIVMQLDQAAATDVTDPQTVRLVLEIRKSSRLRSGLDKYIDSYRWALRYIPFDEQLRNTIVLVILNVAGSLFACSLAAYAFARLRFYGRDFLFGLLLATMMLPGQVTMIPQFVLWKSLGWYNTLRPLWVPAWFGGAFFIFLLRQFFMTIPKELEDAAKIDGCGFFGIYWRIMLPLAAPALATVAIFAFMGAWNEFVGPLVYLSDERLFPLSLGLNQFRQEQSAEWPWLMAAASLMMMPVIAVFFFCQRYFIQGVTLTGLKG